MLDAEALYRLLFTQLLHAYGDTLGRADGVALVGIRSGGAWLAERLAADFAAFYAGEPLSIDAAALAADALATNELAAAMPDLAAPDPELAVAAASLAISASAAAAQASGAIASAPTSPLPSVRHVQHEDDIVFGLVNVSLHRDDFASKGLHGHPGPTQLPFDVSGQRILLVDDVLYTGRTIRAALNELYDYGRPACVELAVLLDRGGRELPFSARFAAARCDIDAGRAVVLARESDGRFSFDTASRVD